MRGRAEAGRRCFRVEAQIRPILGRGRRPAASYELDMVHKAGRQKAAYVFACGSPAAGNVIHCLTLPLRARFILKAGGKNAYW